MKNKKELLYFHELMSIDDYINLAVNKNVSPKDIEFKINDNEIWRRIIDAYGDWTNYIITDKGHFYELINGKFYEKPYYKYYDDGNSQRLIKENNGNIEGIDENELNYYLFVSGIKLWHKNRATNNISLANSARVHILEADAFLKPVDIDGFFMIDHINGIKYDNRLENIRRTNNRGNQIASVKLKMASDQYYFYNKENFRRYSNEQIEEACKLLEENTLDIAKISYEVGIDIKTLYEIKMRGKYPDISHKYNVKNHNKICTIYKLTEELVTVIDRELRRGIQLTDIEYYLCLDASDKDSRKIIKEHQRRLVQDETIPEDYFKGYSDEEYKKCTDLIKEGFRPSVIAKELNHDNDYIYTSFITYLRYKIINSDYGYIPFNEYELNKIDLNTIRENNRDNIPVVCSICRELEKNQLTMGEIANKYCVSKNFVKSIRNKCSWLNISVDYYFDHYEMNESTNLATKENNEKVRALLLKGLKCADVCKELDMNVMKRNLEINVQKELNSIDMFRDNYIF